MSDDILAAFRSGKSIDSLAEFRQKAGSDPEALEEVIHLWLNTTAVMFAPAANAIEYGYGPIESLPGIVAPSGYVELVYLLMWWCDQSPFHIDATPFVDFLIALDDVRDDEWHKVTPAGFRNAKRARKRADHITYRMLNAAFTGAGRRWPAIPLKDNQQEIVDTLREVGHPLKSDDLLSELDLRGLSSSSATKQQFSFLNQIGAMVSTKDGYALPEWVTKR